MMLQNNVRHLLVVDDDKSSLNKPIGIITPLDFTKYQEYTNDEEKDSYRKDIRILYVISRCRGF